MKSRIRKFYLKSKLNFGKYSGKTVKEVIGIGEGPYLRWCNARMNKITFAPECKKYWGDDCPIGFDIGLFGVEDLGPPDGYGDSDPNDNSSKW